MHRAGHTAVCVPERHKAVGEIERITRKPLGILACESLGATARQQVRHDLLGDRIMQRIEDLAG